MATPYTHKDPKIRQKRFEEINKVALRLINEGYYVFSPISHCHPIAKAGNLPTDWEFWGEYCREILRHCCIMFVYMQDGWEKSVGIKEEIKIAKEMGILIEYIELMT